MTTTTDQPIPVREIVCSNCGNMTGEFSRDYSPQVGKCCRALPAMWGEPDEDDEDEERSVPQCSSCGSEEFVLRETVTIQQRRTYRSEQPDDGDTEVWFDSAGGFDVEDEAAEEPSHQVVVCRNCGNSDGRAIHWC